MNHTDRLHSDNVPARAPGTNGWRANGFRNLAITLIVGWLLLFVFLPNLMIIMTSFMTRDHSSLISLVFSLDSYGRLLDPLYVKVLGHSLLMAGLATLLCLIVGYPFAFIIARLPARVRPLMLFLVIVPFWTNSLIRTYALKVVLGTKGLLNTLLSDEEYGRQVSGDLQQLISNLNRLTEKLERGDGTLGALISDPGVYEAVNDILVGINESKLLRWLIRNRQKKGIEKRYEEAQAVPEAAPAAPAPVSD